MSGRRAPILGRWRANARGATAVEFALVALPFIVLLVQIIEISMVFLIYTQLDAAIAIASRQIRTNQFQAGANPTAARFVRLVCANMGMLSATCPSQLQVDVRTETQFGNPSEPDPMAGGSFNTAALTFNPGANGQIVLVRGFYQWPLLMPVIDGALSRTRNGVAVIVSTTTFANEAS